MNDMNRILLIDDEEDFLVTMAGILEGRGYDVIAVSNCKKALRTLHENAVDLVIVDIFMPDMDGLEFIRKVIRDNPELPIVTVTGAAKQLYLEVAQRMGAVSGLLKPIDVDQLMGIVHKCTPLIAKLKR